MNMSGYDEQLAVACQKNVPDLNEIQRLIIAGADVNQLDEHGRTIWDDVFYTALMEAIDVDEGAVTATVDTIKEVIALMVQHGWDTKRFGLEVMHQFLFSTYDWFTFDLYRFMLQYDLSDDMKRYQKALESVGGEESYQRCCEENHDLENLFYAIYELIDAKMNGRDPNSIALYYDAVGMRVDRIWYFGTSDTLVEKENFTEYNADIGLMCDGKLLILRTGVNILFMNDRIEEQPRTDLSERYGETVIGQTIQSISFSHRTVIKGSTHYGQPTIILEFSNGNKMKFTHNFGEMPDKEYQSRFWME